MSEQNNTQHRDQVLEEAAQLCTANAANAKRQAWKRSNKNDPTTYAIWKSRAALALRCPGLATELIKAQKRIVELVDLLIEWQSFANGTTEERAKMAAKVSQYLFHQTAG